MRFSERGFAPSLIFIVLHARKRKDFEMNNCLAITFRAAAWLCAAVSLLDGGIIIFDGLTGRLQMQYRIVSLTVGLAFSGIGAMAVGLERNLGKIYRCLADPELQKNTAALVVPWRFVYGVLIVAVGIVSVLIGLAAIGIIERLRSGHSIFG